MSEFTVSIPTSRPKTFESLSALKEWFLPEADRWKWFLDIPRPYNYRVGKEEADEIVKAFARVRQLIADAEKKGAPELTELKGALFNLQSRVDFLSDDPRWKLCETIAARRPEEAVTTLCAFFAEVWDDSHGLGVHRLRFKAAVNVAAFESGFGGQSAASQVAALEKCLENWQASIEAAKDERQVLRDEHRNVIESGRKQSLEMCDEVRKESDATKKYGEAACNGVQKRTDDFEKFLKEELALKAPVDYWTNRAKSLRQKADSLKCWLITAIVFLFIPAIFFAVHLWKEADDAAHRLYSLALILAIMGFAIWPVRLIARLYMSAVHLEADAMERETMVLTYLSLAEAGHATPTNRRIILASLFRPTQTGIVVEDGAPASVIESLMKVGQPSTPKGS